MDGINWGGLVQRTNPLAELAQGLQVGTEMRQAKERENLFRQRQAHEIEQDRRVNAREDRAIALDQENRLERGLLGYMARTDPAAAARKAVEVGQVDMADSFSKMDEDQRAAARERAGVLAAYVESLQEPQPGQPAPTPQSIKAQILQDAEALEELGFTRQQIEAFEPTLSNLAGLKAKALGLKGMLEERNRLRDDKRAEAKDREMQQYREDMLALAGRRVGVTERREGRQGAAPRAGGGGDGGARGPAPAGGAPWERKW